jgi:hypothetical protein
MAVNVWRNLFYDLLGEMEQRIGADDYLLQEFTKYAEELDEDN